MTRFPGPTVRPGGRRLPTGTYYPRLGSGGGSWGGYWASTGCFSVCCRLQHSAVISTGLPPRSEKISIECLKKTTWAIEPAINLFYSSGLSAVPGNSINMQHIEALYMKYRGTDLRLV